MARNQNTLATSVKMDSRKFLSAINDSAQARVAFYSEKVGEMGKLAGRDWRLAALRNQDLFIEDVNSGNYYVAAHTKNNGAISISNIREIELVEESKAGLFEENCLKLINAIEENDQSKMQAAYSRMRGQRFSGKAIPESGMVRTRDGVIRNISVGKTYKESTKAKLVSAIVESLQDKVIVENGAVVAGYFNNGERFKLPVTKWASRKLVARQMREQAEKAYFSKGFRDRILNIANLVSENKIDAAVTAIKPFLEEMEEFTLLDSQRTHTLIENALAACGIFNQNICEDTATLFYRTNITISKGKIVKEWKRIAQVAEHPVLAENVMILSEAKDFAGAYDKFLHLVFEAISNRQVAAESLATTLEVLKDKTPKIKESHELASKLNGLISRLKRPDFDDAAIYEAEDLIATIQEELSANDSLKDFDSMPGDDSSGGIGSDLGSDIASVNGKGQPIININSPLIQIGGSSGAAQDEEDESLDIPSEDDELDDMLSGGLDDEEMAQPAAPMQSPATPMAQQAPAPPTAAAAAPAPRMESFDSGLDFLMEDEDDPYAYTAVRKSDFVSDYGNPVIKDQVALDRVVNIMRSLAVEHNLVGKALAENLDDIAEASIEAVGLTIPEQTMPSAIEQAVTTFIESTKLPFKGAKPPFKKHGEHASKHHEDEYNKDDFEDDELPWEEEGMAEDQYKSPTMKRSGLRKSSFAPQGKKATSESVQFTRHTAGILEGTVGGVNFLFDYKSDVPQILSEDGISVQIPVPKRLIRSALVAAGAADGDSQPFKRWLRECSEQLRQPSQEEEELLQEAMLKVMTSPDGGMEVEISGDDIDIEGMKPVDGIDIEPEEEDEVEMDTDEMPDFDKFDDKDEEEDEEDEAEEDGEEEDEEEDEEEEEALAEDSDLTNPSHSAYSKTAKEDPRSYPAVPKSKKNQGNKLTGLGPDLKKDNGAGTKPPISGKVK